ncbi:class I SAM-dependent methyltransferase [Nocardiopsis ansamitocini]|uniref:Ubiquinone biosynthesis protein UbiE n=1 Tax=Nocardiopsis ansamitocini TaxID=1670832 RepID=A0A9W6P9V3_9ACTN|nr:class I SAM-dependent methyltransferase [Nocardiopsis ansamitocini]GLU49628.1 ubiquinone biosynthesis protein UbiE [Nocardiopsis ansamitocini]
MLLPDVVAFAGHQIHVCRYREAGTLLRWLGPDLTGQVVLDVAGGDGYWAAQARKRGARAISVDLARAKMVRGSRLGHAPALIEGDALRLPMGDATVDKVMSICAIEHFDDGPAALREMARVLKPGGELVMSADCLSRRESWPKLFDAHRRRYHVQRTYTHEDLGVLLAECGLDVAEHSYQFRGKAAERTYLGLSAHGGRVGFNLAAPLIPFVSLSDRREPNTRGSIVLLRARRRSD